METPAWIVAVHFVVGMVFLALIVATAARMLTINRARGDSWWVWIVFGIATALVVSGTAVVATGSGYSCRQSWPLCSGSMRPSGGLAQVQWTHRVTALVMMARAIALSIVSWRRTGRLRQAAVLLTGLVIAQTAVGAAVVMTANDTLRQVLEITHVGGAATIWTLVTLIFTGRSGRASRQQPRRLPT